jgi:hypothetical protein
MSAETDPRLASAVLGRLTACGKPINLPHLACGKLCGKAVEKLWARCGKAVENLEAKMSYVKILTAAAWIFGANRQNPGGVKNPTCQKSDMSKIRHVKNPTCQKFDGLRQKFDAGSVNFLTSETAGPNAIGISTRARRRDRGLGGSG